MTERATTLGQVIRDRRRELGWTQEGLAARVDHGVAQSDVSRLERGKIMLPRRQRLERIAAALELPLGVLLARSGWAGAERLIVDEPVAAATGLGEARPERLATSSGRLRALIARSRELEHQTEALLRQTELTATSWERSLQRQRGAAREDESAAVESDE